VRAVIRKIRTVYFCGQTRIHFDRVTGLGEFIELEVVLKPGEETAHGIAIAEALMSKLGIEKHDLVAEAYVDLFVSSGPLRRSK
jgi:adenylate cyclase